MISQDLLNCLLTGADGQNARRHIDVVNAWGPGGRAYYNEDLSQHHWHAALDEASISELNNASIRSWGC